MRSGVIDDVRRPDNEHASTTRSVGPTEQSGAESALLQGSQGHRHHIAALIPVACRPPACRCCRRRACPAGCWGFWARAVVGDRRDSAAQSASTRNWISLPLDLRGVKAREILLYLRQGRSLCRRGGRSCAAGRARQVPRVPGARQVGIRAGGRGQGGRTARRQRKRSSPGTSAGGPGPAVPNDLDRAGRLAAALRRMW